MLKYKFSESLIYFLDIALSYPIIINKNLNILNKSYSKIPESKIIRFGYTEYEESIEILNPGLLIGKLGINLKKQYAKNSFQCKIEEYIKYISSKAVFLK